jgi:LysR family transcriptional regulator (chromosome initiation inhibitor)
MHLNPKHTEAFRAVIESGSFEQAAVRLHLTSPAISQRVRALESMLGNALVVRSRPARATRTGQLLMRYLRRAQLLETDLATELAVQQDAPLTLVLALNADSVGTWFFPALSEMLIREKVLLDLTVEDQDHTYMLLETGLAIGCISTEPKPMRGCLAERLGVMTYWLVAAPDFGRRWFPDGVTREAARDAPLLAHTHKDTLQSSFLQQKLGLPEGAYPCHYIPGAQSHFNAIRHGLGYGLVPALLLDAQTFKMTVLAPADPVQVALYWHTWKVQSPRMEHISQHIISAAQKMLM